MEVQEMIIFKYIDSQREKRVDGEKISLAAEKSRELVFPKQKFLYI